ncbi:DinB family protein [Amycolatopsis acidicola]|uniref:DinB family protein n=1 Tax=Amycolatopsis acidicola TaxID=2596893 RepID=A0A5N0VNE3_9PSEU|nr:DinB family protein [Amycolatopsis acidicola]KAA9166720.1 DinB family protein [Amycolatopsis acidicola]
MTWTAPEAEIVFGATAADERTMLAGYLDWHRSVLLHKCAGLTGEQLAERSVEPSSLSLLGLIRHMAKVERIWFRERFANLPVERLHAGTDTDFDQADPARAAEDYAQLLEERRQADEIAARASLEDTFTFDENVFSLRFVYLHLIQEYARHNGHADLLRERIDGVTGA